MSKQTIRLRAMIDQARAAVRERLAGACITVGQETSDGCDETVDKYFAPLLGRIMDDDLSEEFDSEFCEFLVGCGLLFWAEAECDRIESETED